MAIEYEKNANHTPLAGCRHHPCRLCQRHDRVRSDIFPSGGFTDLMAWCRTVAAGRGLRRSGDHFVHAREVAGHFGEDPLIRLLPRGSVRVRFAVSITFVAALAVLYVRALASASAFHTSSAFAHPWPDLITDIFLLGLSMGTFVCLVPAVRGVGMRARMLGLVLLLLPCSVLGHFVLWVARIYWS
jgi:hypothetical protein